MKREPAKDIENNLGDIKIDVGLQLLELRIIKNITQAKLAKLIGTKQPSIARAERGAVTPSLDFLNKIAVSLNTKLISPKFEVVEENDRRYESNVTEYKTCLTAFHSKRFVPKESLLTSFAFNYSQLTNSNG